MAIPDYQTIMFPLLKQIADGEVHTVRNLKDVLVDQFNLTEEEREHLVPSGTTTTFHSRLAWAKTYLQQAGLIENVKWGHFKISNRGKDVLTSGATQINNQFLEQFPEFLEFKSGNSSSGNGRKNVATTNDDQTPEEALEAAHQRIKDDLSAKLVEQIAEMTPTFFERLVLDLMTEMGYGGTRESASMTKRGADEGIDGVINEDRLGLDVVYLQAKRWQNPVGRPEIQKFVGALHGKRARKGVFLTTSTFSKDAHEYVATIDPKVVLIDGKRLAQLMIDFGVGVSTVQQYAVKRIDTDYFTED